MHSLGNSAFKGIVRNTEIALHDALRQLKPELTLRETGCVTMIGGGIARITGLPSLGSEEIVRFSTGITGIATDLGADDASVILLADAGSLRAGMHVTASGQVASVPVGYGLLGRVINAQGQPLDNRGPITTTAYRAIERGAPSILERLPVTVPLETGIKVVDALIPVGRGQRELILGDRQTGKTSVAIEAVLNQRNKNVLCIYCTIGQRGTSVARVIETLQKHGAMAYTTVVVASGNDVPGLQYITPYAATSIAEFYRDDGRDVLIVYDDLTRHARVYRELSLLLRRPPGREAYPGDIFYIHSRLLERSTRMNSEQGGGSLTALPIIETQSQDISAFIPTNLISITDGQIYLSPDLFHKGHLPAIDIGRSVSRVGGTTQSAAFRAVASPLRLAYAQFEELQAFSRFATRLDSTTKATLQRGQRVRDALMQREYHPVRAASQVAALKSVSAGTLDGLSSEQTLQCIQAIQDSMPDRLPLVTEIIESGNMPSDEQWQAIIDLARECVIKLNGECDGHK